MVWAKSAADDEGVVASVVAVAMVRTPVARRPVEQHLLHAVRS